MLTHATGRWCNSRGRLYGSDVCCTPFSGFFDRLSMPDMYLVSTLGVRTEWTFANERLRVCKGGPIGRY